MSVNKAILIGNLGQDPELRYTPNGRAMAKFTIATNRRWSDQEGNRQEATTWHNIIAWGRRAEVIKEYLSKGRQIYIEGRIDNRTYEKQDGTKGYWSEVVVENFQFLGDRGDSGGDRTYDRSDTQEQPSSAPTPPAGDAGDDDDLPF